MSKKAFKLFIQATAFATGLCLFSYANTITDNYPKFLMALGGAFTFLWFLDSFMKRMYEAGYLKTSKKKAKK